MPEWPKFKRGGRKRGGIPGGRAVRSFPRVSPFLPDLGSAVSSPVVFWGVRTAHAFLDLFRAHKRV